MQVWLFHVTIHELNIWQGEGQIQGHGGLPRSSFAAGYRNDHKISSLWMFYRTADLQIFGRSLRGRNLRAAPYGTLQKFANQLCRFPL